MKKIIILSGILMLFCATTLSAQSFLKKAINKVEKGIDALLGTDTSSSESTVVVETREEIAEAVAPAPEPPAASQGNPSDLEKENIKGRVKSITETTTDPYGTSRNVRTFNENGMFLTIGDNIRCEYDVDGRLIRRHLSDGAYIDDESYDGPVTQLFTYDDNGRLIEMRSGDEVFKYEYNDRGQLVRRTKSSNDDRQFSPINYVYNNKGQLIEEHMGDISQWPWRDHKYDSKGRLIETLKGDARYHYKLNEHGDIIEEKRTETFGHDEDSVTYNKYIYDARGNWIERQWGYDGEWYITTKREIEYYE